VHAFVPLEQNCRVAVPPPPPPPEQYIDDEIGSPTYGQQKIWIPPPEPTHAHTMADMPNLIDRNGGWTDTGECFSEEPVRRSPRTALNSVFLRFVYYHLRTFDRSTSSPRASAAARAAPTTL
jgi:hypothetical protein